MTPVKQSKLYAVDGIHCGNCFAACLASLLDLPLWMVPPFEDMYGRSTEHYMTRCNLWLARIFKLRLVKTEAHDLALLPEFYIANGPSPRGVYHSVIYSNGKLAHDPHPSDQGVAEIEWCWNLAPL